MQRKDLIKFIQEPKNSDVIVYDTNLKDLIGVDVFQEYYNLYPKFISKREEYTVLKQRIDEYKNSIENLYFYNKNWNEQDYLLALQNDKKTYSILFAPVKKVESQLNTLRKKLDIMNDRIKIQMQKEEKIIQDRKDDVDNEIEKNKNKLFEERKILEIYQSHLEDIEKRLTDNETEFLLLNEMFNAFESGDKKCPCCGNSIKKFEPNTLIYKRTINKIENNKIELEKILRKKNDIEKEIEYHKSEISKIKTILNNDIQFKKDKENSYHKKSIEVLKLEGLRDEIIKDIASKEKWLETNNDANDEKCKKIRANIEKYERSLENLTIILDKKEKLKDDISTFGNLTKELKQIYSKIESYKKFIELYFKIYEQKANEYMGDKFKFKIFKFDDFELKEIFEIYYEGIEYNFLDKKQKEEVDKILIEKFEIYL